jgi:hypothetical protein
LDIAKDKNGKLNEAKNAFDLKFAQDYNAIKINSSQGTEVGFN